MADWWVDSASGANTNAGSAYTAPKKSLWCNDGVGGNSLFNGTDTKPAAGDTVYVLDGHDETGLTTANVTLTNNGSDAAPIKVINVASFASGTPTTLGTARNAVVGHAVASTSGRIFLRTGLIIYGVHIKAAELMGTDNVHGALTLHGCQLEQLRVTNEDITLGGSVDCTFNLYDVYFKFAANGTLNFSDASRVKFYGGKIIGGTGSYLMDLGNYANVIEIFGFDFSGTSATYLFGAASAALDASLIILNGCKLPSSYTLTNTIVDCNIEVLALNCQNGAGNVGVEYAQFAGEVIEETTIVRTGGASVDGSGYAFKMLPTTNANENHTLRCVKIHGHEDFSSSKTIDIYIGNATRDLDDDEIWMELYYPAYNVGGHKIATNRGTNWLVAATTHTDDTGSTWGGGGLTYMQKMSITAGGATDGREGPFTIMIFLAVDVDVYVDPEPVVT